MKFRTLRNKITREFAEVQTLADGCPRIYTSEFPFPLAETATLEMMEKYYDKYHPEHEIDFENYEIAEFEMFEVNTVGADIRNKLSPCLNLVSLLKVYFKETDEGKKYFIKRFIKREMTQSKKNIKYISNLL